jgi:gluconolactonase
MKSDNKGNLFVAGPDAIYVITPGGKLLGKIKAPEHIANLAWGDDGRSLYITASHGLYKIRLNTEGKMLSGSQTP